MTFRITPQGDIVNGPSGDTMRRPAQTLGMSLLDPGARGNVAQSLGPLLDVGFNSRRVLDRAAAPFSGDWSDKTLVAPSLLEHSRENPLGSAARFLDRAVDTLISTALGAGASRSWSLQDSRSAFALAFGVDSQSSQLRNQILGASPDPPHLSLDDSLPPELRDRLSAPIDFGSPRNLGDPPFDSAMFRPLDDLFNRTCVLGVFDALQEFGRAVADAPREYTAARIDKLVPNYGCPGDKIRILGTGFGTTQAVGLDLLFPAYDGGWLSVDVPPADWTDTEITVTLPAGVGSGSVGFVQVNPAATPPAEAAGRLVGEMTACFGPAAQLRAQSVFAKMGTLAKVSITDTSENQFRGGRPKIDYFLANGAQRALIRPGGPLLLQWSAINADNVILRKAAGAPTELPAIPAGSLKARDEISFPAVSSAASWTGNYEIAATNSCGEVSAAVEIQMRSRKALALAGGGSKGAFEVGAVRCLYDVFDYQPDLLTGASVGALNAAKLAEGPAALPELEQLWLGMAGPEDLFLIRAQINTILTQLDPAIRQLLQLTPLEDLLGWSATPTSTAVLNLNIGARALSWANSGIGSAAGTGTLFTIFDILMAGLDFGLKLGKIVQAIQQLLLQPSLFLFNPVRDKIQANVSPAKVTASGLALRIVVNGLRTGKVRYVDESGGFVDGGPAPGIVEALTASASIPVAFAPVRLPDGEDYVDGGVLENAPIEAAVLAGADSIIAILPSPAELNVPLSPPTTLLPVTERAIALLLDGSSRRQLAPFRGWGVPVMVIAPRFELHSLLAVDPGMIRIDMDYGYMRAYDEMQSNDALRASYRANSDAVSALRQTVWYQEHWVHGQYPKGFQRTGQIQPTGSSDQVLWIRDRKKAIRDLVVARVGLSGVSVKSSVPNGIEKAWRDWEAHFFDVYFNTPWDGFSSYPGPILQPEAPPPPLP